MPCGYHMNLEDGLITVDGTDASTFSDLLSVGRELLADPQFDPNLPQLVDLRGMRIHRDVQSSASLRQFTIKAYRPQVLSSVAVVVDDHLTNDLLAAIYHLVCALEQTELFDHYDQAIKWLMRREFAAKALSAAPAG
jgi:hypothetical protein